MTRFCARDQLENAHACHLRREIVIELLAGFPDDVLGFAYKGHVTKADYETVVIPAVVKALEKRKNLRLYFAVQSDFSGIDAGALWEDLKVGTAHLARWERVAVVTDIHWIEQSMRFVNLLLPCPMKTFPTSEAAQARVWITAAS
jgi:hypothetical protein